ncbi:MAG: peptide-methionine (S)-S-oxide reductase MsrA [Bacteroidetes bacterium]|nr:peptide-methionine (S)-S-oxide reductase MsrA [Bacteroidota bacterium]MDA0907470.1 peptide-methionine (S)-S-oxide reductase MsrA [Bacteroidota bacterium]
MTAETPRTSTPSNPNLDTEVAILGAGCFWCVEAIYEELQGTVSVESGYTGGHVKDPTYKQVVTGQTGHAEVVRLEYDPSIISFEEVLIVFYHTHDPTTLNRQGADVGTQYRSAIFYANDEQKQIAEKVTADITAEKLWDDPIVTEITPLDVYYPAENYHQDYYENNPNAPYCTFVIAPKLAKFRKEFKHLLKSS